jgi:hypothetical protein
VYSPVAVSDQIADLVEEPFERSDVIDDDRILQAPIHDSEFFSQ